MSSPSPDLSPRVLLTPAQAAARYQDADGSPVFTEGALSQIRYEEQNLPAHKRTGPPFIKPRGRVYYPAAEFDAWVMQWAGGEPQALQLVEAAG